MIINSREDRCALEQLTEAIKVHVSKEVVVVVPQLVAELGRLIQERCLWNVTEQDKNSFVVPFPSRGDLLRFVAFGKAEMKEHGVSLLFEEWKQEEEGHPL
jgi:hypothetical protein